MSASSLLSPATVGSLLSGCMRSPGGKCITYSIFMPVFVIIGKETRNTINKRFIRTNYIYIIIILTEIINVLTLLGGLLYWCGAIAAYSSILIRLGMKPARVFSYNIDLRLKNMSCCTEVMLTLMRCWADATDLIYLLPGRNTYGISLGSPRSLSLKIFIIHWHVVLTTMNIFLAIISCNAILWN